MEKLLKQPVLERDTFSLQVHNFLDTIRTKNLDTKQKLQFSTFINELSKATEIQKRRFLMYYNLNLNGNQHLRYTDIGKIEHCSCSAIRISVGAIILQLIKLEDNQKVRFLDIISEIDTKK